MVQFKLSCTTCITHESISLHLLLLEISRLVHGRVLLVGTNLIARSSMRMGDNLKEKQRLTGSVGMAEPFEITEREARGET